MAGSAQKGEKTMSKPKNLNEGDEPKPQKSFPLSDLAPLFSSVQSYYAQMVRYSGAKEKLASLKAVYATLFAKIEHNLRKKTGLNFTKIDIDNMDGPRLSTFRRVFHFFWDYSDDEIRDYLNFVVEIRGFNTHFVSRSMPSLPPVVTKILTALHPQGKPLDQNDLTFFGMALVLAPLANNDMMSRFAFALVAKRACFGTEGITLAPHAAALAKMLINPTQPPLPEDNDLPASVHNLNEYKFLCSNFFEDASEFFLLTEAKLSEKIKAKYQGSEDYLKRANGSISELMAEAHYLPGEENSALRDDIVAFRNAIFHGEFLEEEVIYSSEIKPLKLSFVLDILQRWEDALNDPEDKKSHIERAIRCLSAFIQDAFARLIEVSYKIRCTKYFDEKKFFDRIDDLNKANQKAKEEIWDGYQSALGMIVRYCSRPAYALKISRARFIGEANHLFYDVPGKLILEQYRSANGIRIGGIDSKTNELTFVHIPDQGFPFTSISDNVGNSFYEEWVDTDGIFEIHVFTV